MCPDRRNSVAPSRWAVSSLKSLTKKRNLKYCKLKLALEFCSQQFVELLIPASASPGSSSTLVRFQQVHLWELGTREPYCVPDRLPIKRAATSSYFLCPTHKSLPPFFDSGAVPLVSTSFWTRFPLDRSVLAARCSHCTDSNNRQVISPLRPVVRAVWASWVRFRGYSVKTCGRV
jgi:hypothetical protein